MKHYTYPIIKDIGIEVHETFETSFSAFDTVWKFLVRNKSEKNMAKGCLTYYKNMWLTDKVAPISEEDTVIDIGAHIGFFCIPISLLAKKVIAFEPAPANFELLQKNILLNNITNIIEFPEAVSDFEGVTKLNCGIRVSTAHTIAYPKQGEVSVSVMCRSLANLISEYNPTILKLDCEGSEGDILSKPELLNNIRIIIAELHRVLGEDDPKIKELKNTLSKADMKFVIKIEKGWSKLAKLTAWRQ